MEKYLDDKLLETLLKENSRRTNIMHLTGRHLKAIFSDGDHYLSLTWKETATVCDDNGHSWKVNLVIKSVPMSQLSKCYIENEGIFKKEIMVYTELLPLLDEQMNTCELGGYPLWPKYLGVDAYNLILLQDLTSKGFRKVDRQIGLDYEHSLLAFKAIAKFHVLSISIKDKLDKYDTMFKQHSFASYSPKRLGFFELKAQELSQEILTSWEPKWHKFAEYLQSHRTELYNKLIQKFQINENNFNVLNHGDLWTSNILFQHCEFTDNLIGIRFVDYQLCHYNSFAMDLQYILQTSLQPNVRKHHTEELLNAYHEILVKTAKKLALPDNIIPSLSSIKAEMMDKIFVGIYFAIYLLDVMLVDPDQADNLETLLNQGLNILSRKVMPTDVYKQRMQAVLEPYIDIDLRNL